MLCMKNGGLIGGDNTGVGHAVFPLLTTGEFNVAIGSGAGGTLLTGSNNIYIAASATIPGEATTTRIGTVQTDAYMAGIYQANIAATGYHEVYVDSFGKLGMLPSSQKVKNNILDMNDDSANVLKLRPVTFAYNYDETNTKQYGLIAEEVDTLLPHLVVKDKDGVIKTVQYTGLNVLLLNELQKLHARVELQGIHIEQQQIIIDNLKERLNILEQK
jgi:hypothetical protein